MWLPFSLWERGRLADSITLYTTPSLSFFLSFSLSLSFFPSLSLSLSHTHTHIHTQLFRADLISAMKLPDSVPMEAGSFLTIKEPWRTEWEVGVQVSNSSLSPPLQSSPVYIVSPI